MDTCTSSRNIAQGKQSMTFPFLTKFKADFKNINKNRSNTSMFLRNTTLKQKTGVANYMCHFVFIILCSNDLKSFEIENKMQGRGKKAKCPKQA